ncbi:hypothetical protein [Amycolatopsis sp. NPDC059021]|uniref:hypothetical protein n=1 Tax=Amycolatopsis sp. NPDC059021 TaxID=3346704 RepID=UPI00366AF069
MVEDRLVGPVFGAEGADWQLTVESRARRVRADLAAYEHLPGTEHARHSAIASLKVVDAALQGAPHRWWSVASWWSGWHIERAWRALHEAEISAISIDPELPGRLPGLRARIDVYLPCEDPRSQALQGLDLSSRVTAADRAVVVDALRAAFDASDDAHAAARALRNKLVLATVALFILNTVLGVIGIVRPGLVPLCIPAQQSGPATMVCPSGGTTPTGWDVWLAQMFGTLGAGLSVVVLLIRRRPEVTPYVLTGYQALIKVLFGATLAVVGLLAFSAGLAQGIVCISSQSALLLWSVLLGYAQHVGTRMLDKYADRIMDDVRPVPEQPLERPQPRG